MKRIALALLLLALLIPSASAAVAPVRTVKPVKDGIAPTSESIRYIPYTIGSIHFIVPDDFVDVGSENETIFSASNGVQMRFDRIDMSGKTLEESVQEFDDGLPFMQIDYTIEENAQGLPFANCNFASPVLSTYGLAALFLDSNAGIVYSFVMASSHEYTDDEIATWKTIVDSISESNIAQQNRPTPTPSPEPTPAPTPTPEPTPTPLPALDFDAVNRNPDKYKYQSFLISGHVLQIIEEYNEEEKNTYVSARVATSGNYDDVVYVVYIREPGEDRILEGDNITFDGTAYGLYTYTSIDDFSITLPLFFLDRVVSID